MEFLSITHLLRRRRLLVGAALLASIVLGAAAGGVFPPRAAPGPASGQALARVFVDTGAPLVASTTPHGSDTIIQRSVLLAALMGSDAMTEEIAHRAGVQASQLAVVTPTFAPIVVDTYLPGGEAPGLTAVAAQKGAGATPFVVQLSTDGGDPVISIGAGAPTVRRAAALAQATIATLVSAATTASGGLQAPRITSLGPVRAVAVPAPTSSRLLGIAVAAAAFFVCCAGIVIAAGLARAWRRAGAPALDPAS